MTQTPKLLLRLMLPVGKEVLADLRVLLKAQEYKSAAR